MRHVLSIEALGRENLAFIVNQGVAIAKGHGAGELPLAGRMVGIYFRRSSTRTRTSFTVGAFRLGAGTIHYGPDDLQIVTGESIEDTARVLSGFLDVLVVRTNEPLAEMQALAAQNRMAIINAMSAEEHPTQAITDLITMREALGRLDGIHVLYLGEGNNTAASLALAMALTHGMHLTLVTPENYGLSAKLLDTAQKLARQNGSLIEQHHAIDRLPVKVDVVYTTRWQTMGVPKADEDWRDKFAAYRVTPKLMAHVSTSETIFLHDLPAMRGSEVYSEVLDGPQSRAFQQAGHKLTAAMAVLSWCVAEE